MSTADATGPGPGYTNFPRHRRTESFAPPQMGFEVNNNATIKTQIVQFADGDDPYVVSMPSEQEATRTGQDSSDDNLGSFLSRPVKIHEETWTTGTDVATTFDPWSLFFSQNSVAARINNYHLMRCKLHLKFMINGNSFLYGKAIAGYQPHASKDMMSFQTLSNEAVTQLSQLPHIYLDPTTSTGGEIVVPFFYYYNNLEIPKKNWSDMGLIRMISLNQLRHANSGTERVTITVLAWVEDLQLSIPTSLAIPEMGMEQEEGNKTGMVSGPATAMAAAAGSLTRIPALAPYAKATQMVMQATALTAKVFGFSRPTRTSDPSPMKPKAFSDLAITTTPDGAAKLTVDDQQELSIDQRIAGLSGGDPLVISEIAQRESYLLSFPWSANDSPETMLWNTRVSPVTWTEDTGTPVGFTFPACAMAALPFKYWTGTMKFRFQIAASSFHRGRLRIVYDPNYINPTEYNTNYMEIVDIQDKKDFCICLTVAQDRTFLEHALPGDNSVAQVYDSSSAFATRSEQANGTLGIYVLNELTTPADPPTPVEINVFVSMGEDFEVAVPDAHFSRFVANPQMGMEVDEDTNHIQNEPESCSNECQLIDTMTHNPHLYDVYMGEAIKSFRPLLKRYSLHEAVGPLETGDKVLAMRRSLFPYLRGNVPGAVHRRNTIVPYNFCNTLLMHWVTWAFQGWRGGIRYKILPRGAITGSTKTNLVEIQRALYYNDSVDTQYSQGDFSWDFYTTESQAARAAVQGNNLSVAPYARQSLQGIEGMTRVIDKININTEFEVPFYSSGRYYPGKNTNWTESPTILGTPLGVDTSLWNGRIFVSGGTTTLFEIYTAVAEDFQVYFFTGLPKLYYELNPPGI